MTVMEGRDITSAWIGCNETSNGLNLGEWTMSLSRSAEILESQREGADRNLRGYGFVLSLVCVVLALVLASAIFTPVSIGSGIDNDTSLVGP
jgi:hypothetical protein